MSSYLSDLDHHKINAQVFPGCVVEIYQMSDSANGQRKEPKTKIWKVEKVLGKGSSGEVRLETNQEGYEKRAVKRIWTSGTTLQKEYKREIMALLEFSKPKYKEAAVFVEFKGWFEDHDCVYLTTEYMPLGDLEHNVPAKSRITEGEVRDITSQILEGLRIMHLENFAHRDLKPKNVLVCRGPPQWWVKLTDFGLSKKRTEDTELRTQAGTQCYMAPEVLSYVTRADITSNEYTNAIDLWALGCIIYRLASGFVPFPPGLSLINFCSDKSGFPFHFLALGNLGLEFLRGLLEPYPAQRLTAQQALNHPWMSIDLEHSYLNTNRDSIRTDQPSNGSTSLSFGQYRTDTHPGLRSYESSATVTSPSLGPRQSRPGNSGWGKPPTGPPRNPELGLAMRTIEIGAVNMNKPKNTTGVAQSLLPSDTSATKPSPGVITTLTKEQLAGQSLSRDVIAMDGNGSKEQQRLSELEEDTLHPASSSPRLETQARNTPKRGPMTITGYSLHSSVSKAATNFFDALVSFPFVSNASVNQASSLAQPVKSVTLSTRGKSQRLRRNQATQFATADHYDPNTVPELLTPPAEYRLYSEEQPKKVEKSKTLRHSTGTRPLIPVHPRFPAYHGTSFENPRSPPPIPRPILDRQHNGSSGLVPMRPPPRPPLAFMPGNDSKSGITFQSEDFPALALRSRRQETQMADDPPGGIV